MASTLQMAAADPAMLAVVRQCRQLLHRRALVAGVASAVPVPGLDWAVDAALLSRLIPAINAAFGLTPEPLDRLDPRKPEQLRIDQCHAGRGVSNGGDTPD